MKKLLLAALCAVGFSAPAFSQTTTVTATNLKMGGTPIAVGTITITPVSRTGDPLSFTDATGSLNDPTGFTGSIINGAISNGGLVVPDQALSTATVTGNPLYYSVSIYNTNTKKTFSFLIPPSSVTGSSFALDHFAPAQYASVTPAGLGVGSSLPNGGRCTAPAHFATFSGTTITATYECVGGLFVQVPGGGGGTTDYNALQNKPNLAAVATSGNYGDLSNKPSIPAPLVAGTDYATPSALTNAVAGEATLARNASNLSSGTVLPALLPNMGAHQVNPMAAPFYASNQGLTTTTTTASLASGSQTVPVSSCSTFLANNGVYIAGAGASGTNYIGTVSACSGSMMTITPATSASVASGVTVQHDETTAILAAINSYTSAGLRIVFPDGYYLVNGPLQQTSGVNAVLPFPNAPYITNSQPPNITLEGLLPPAGGGGLALTGAHILTNQTSGNFINAYCSGSTLYGQTGFCNYGLIVRNLTLTGPATNNHTLHMINGTNFMQLDAEHLRIEANLNPTVSGSVAIQYPKQLNQVANFLDDVTVTGYDSAYIFTEHTRIGSAFAAYGNDCFVFDSGPSTSFFGPTYTGNSIHADYLWEQGCNHGVVGRSNYTIVNIANADMESINSGGAMIYDPSNNLHGFVGVTQPYAPYTITQTGGTGLSVFDLAHGQFTTLNASQVNVSGSNQYLFGPCLYNGSNPGSVCLSLLGTGYSQTQTGTGHNAHVHPFAIYDATQGANNILFTKSYTALPLGSGYGFTSTAEPGNSAVDTMLGRKSANVACIGNGTQIGGVPDCSGAIQTAVVAGGSANGVTTLAPATYGNVFSIGANATLGSGLPGQVIIVASATGSAVNLTPASGTTINGSTNAIGFGAGTYARHILAVNPGVSTDWLLIY